MITCLSNFFGLRDVSGFDSPESGRFINELPGFKTSILDEIRDDEDTVEQAWTNIYNRANNLFEQDVMSAMKKYFRKYQLIDTSVTSELDSTDQLLSENYYNGWLFDVQTWSKNTKLVIEKVNFHLDTAQSGTIYIFDAWTGKTLFSNTFTGVEGINQVMLNKEYATYKHNRVYVAYDSSEIQPYKLQDLGFGFSVANRKKVLKTSSVIKSNMSFSESGLSVTFSLKCSLDNFICQRLSVFSEAFLYKLGIEFLKECKYSSELNRYTLLDLDEKNEAINDFKEEYDKMIDNSLKDLNMTDNDVCFHCSKPITQKLMIP